MQVSDNNNDYGTSASSTIYAMLQPTDTHTCMAELYITKE